MKFNILINVKPIFIFVDSTKRKIDWKKITFFKRRVYRFTVD